MKGIGSIQSILSILSKKCVFLVLRSSKAISASSAPLHETSYFRSVRHTGSTCESSDFGQRVSVTFCRV
jgi:hypothetical protein